MQSLALSVSPAVPNHVVELPSHRGAAAAAANNLKNTLAPSTFEISVFERQEVDPDSIDDGLTVADVELGSSLGAKPQQRRRQQRQRQSPPPPHYVKTCLSNRHLFDGPPSPSPHDGAEAEAEGEAIPPSYDEALEEDSSHNSPHTVEVCEIVGDDDGGADEVDVEVVKGRVESVGVMTVNATRPGRWRALVEGYTRRREGTRRARAGV